MRIKDLPEPAKSLAFKYQEKNLGKVNPNDFLLTAFNWADTKEGSEYWTQLVTSNKTK